MRVIQKRLNVDCGQSWMNVYCDLNQMNVWTHLYSYQKQPNAYFAVKRWSFYFLEIHQISCWPGSLTTVCCVLTQLQIYCLIHYHCFLSHWKSCHLVFRGKKIYAQFIISIYPASTLNKHFWVRWTTKIPSEPEWFWRCLKGPIVFQ